MIRKSPKFPPVIVAARILVRPPKTQAMPKKDKRRLAIGEGNGHSVIEATTETHEESLLSTIPAPHDMREYQQIVPDFADRVLIMAEKQQTANIRHEDTDLEIEKQHNSREYDLAKRAQWIVVLFIVLGVGLCGYGFFLGLSWPPYAAFGSLIVFVLWALKKRR